MENHPHRHTMITECVGAECQDRREVAMTHTHDDGHKIHQHDSEDIAMFKKVEPGESQPQQNDVVDKSWQEVWR